MDLYRLLLLFVYVIVVIDETYCHPKSWLTTTKLPKPKPKKPKRSVANVDVTYYPGLTAEYKDALRFEELRKFLQEEEEDAEGEEDVILRLLQEEQELTTDEPIEFAVQKRVMMQLKNLQSPLHETLGVIEFPEENLGFEAHLDIPHNQQNGNDFLRLESFKYTFEDAEPQRYKKTVTPVSDHPNIDDIPEAVIKRLLLDEAATPSSDDHGDSDLQKHINTPYNHPLHHDIEVNLRHRQNYDHDGRHKFFLDRLLAQQEQIDIEDLGFLTESENNEDVGMNRLREVEPSSDAILEAQLDWEEYHENDA